MVGSDRSLAPGEGFLVDFDPVVRALEKSDQAHGQVADSGADIEHSMLGTEPGDVEFESGIPARASEGARIPRPVVIDPQMRRGQ